jgi:hypothetical protein
MWGEGETSRRMSLRQVFLQALCYFVCITSKIFHSPPTLHKHNNSKRRSTNNVPKCPSVDLDTGGNCWALGPGRFIAARRPSSQLVGSQRHERGVEDKTMNWTQIFQPFSHWLRQYMERNCRFVAATTFNNFWAAVRIIFLNCAF